jgi:hypothetical protein
MSRSDNRSRPRTLRGALLGNEQRRQHRGGATPARRAPDHRQGRTPPWHLRRCAPPNSGGPHLGETQCRRVGRSVGQTIRECGGRADLATHDKVPAAWLRLHARTPSDCAIPAAGRACCRVKLQRLSSCPPSNLSHPGKGAALWLRQALQIALRHRRIDEIARQPSRSATLEVGLRYLRCLEMSSPMDLRGVRQSFPINRASVAREHRSDEPGATTPTQPRRRMPEMNLGNRATGRSVASRRMQPWTCSDY